MKKIKKYSAGLISILLCLVISGCFNPLGKLRKEIVETESWTTTVYTGTTTANETTDINETTESLVSETTASFVPQFANKTTGIEESATTTESTTPTPTVTDDGLLKAEAFTIEDILANGPLYDRRDQFDPQFIEDALEYFPEIAGGNEFDPTVEPRIAVWDVSKPIKIALLSDFTDQDQQILDKIIPPIKILTNLDIVYVEADESYNYEYHIAPLDKFPNIFEQVEEDNWGLVNFWYGDDYIRYYAISAVSNDHPNRLEMNHLIIEEFIQSLGLPNDSYRYEDSIFQQDWTDVQEPMPIDWLLLEFVYRPELKPGMHVDECVEILRGLYLD